MRRSIQVQMQPSWSLAADVASYIGQMTKEMVMRDSRRTRGRLKCKEPNSSR